MINISHIYIYVVCVEMKISEREPAVNLHL